MDKRKTLRCFVVALCNLRCISFTSGGVREALLKALTHKQFTLAVAVRKKPFFSARLIVEGLRPKISAAWWQVIKSFSSTA